MDEGWIVELVIRLVAGMGGATLGWMLGRNRQRLKEVQRSPRNRVEWEINIAMLMGESALVIALSIGTLFLILLLDKDAVWLYGVGQGLGFFWRSGIIKSMFSKG